MISDARRWLTLGLVLVCFSAGSALPQEYRLTVGDEVEFDILDDEEPTRTVTLAQDGRVQFPLIGTLSIAGLTVTEAQDRIRETYINRELLRDPKVSLSIAAFRPVFVLGDIESPGIVDYRARMTVEQAVGLAGGPSRISSSTDERMLNEAVLRGELRILTAQINQQAAVIARLKAQIDAGDVLDLETVPEAARQLTTPEQFAEFAAIETRILEENREQLASASAALSVQSEAMSQELQFLDERITNQRAQIERQSSERDRVADLSERGLTNRVGLVDAEEDLNDAYNSLLETQRKQAESLRIKSDIDQRLDQLTRADRRQTLTDTRTALLELDRLVERRKSTEEQVYLVTSWQSTRSQDALSIETRYRIRREIDGKLETEAASLTDFLLPGDVVLVSIETPS